MSTHASAQLPERTTRPASTAATMRLSDATPEVLRRTPAPVDSGGSQPGYGHSFKRVPVQPALYIGGRHDAFERQADSIADALTRPSSRATFRTPPPITTAALCLPRSGDDGDAEAPGQEKSSGSNPSIVPAAMAQRLQRSEGGQPLASTQRDLFERRLGRDLGAVRTHTDAQAAADSKTLNARAFARGQHIYFGEGQYRPETSAGRWLLAHEVAHTTQNAPNILARFVADASLPEAEAPEQPEETFNRPGSDPSDTSGRVATRLAGLDPPRRAKVLAKLREKQKTEPRDAEEPTGPAPGSGARTAQPDSGSTRARRSVAHDLPGEKVPASRLSTARRNAVQTVRAPAPARAPDLPARPTPPPVPSPRRPSMPASPASAPRGEPRSALTQQRALPQSAGPALQAANAPPTTSEAQQRTGEPAARGPGDNEPLHLADLFEKPAASSETRQPPGTAQAAVPAASADGMVGVDQTINGGSTASLPLAIGAAEPGLLEDGVAGAVGPGRASDEAAMEGFASQLEAALENAQTTLDAQAETVRSSIRQQAASARAGIRAEVTRTSSEIQAGSNALLTFLDGAVSAAHSQIDACLAARRAEAAEAGTTSQDTVRGIFRGHRTTVETTVSTAITDAESLRTRKAESVRDRNRADIRKAYSLGDAKMHSYPNTERGTYIGLAAFDVAEGAAEEMQKQEPDIISGIEEITAPLPEHFRTQGAQALDGFDVNLPQILDSVGSGVAQTVADIDRKAADAHVRVDEMAAQARAEITTAAAEAIAQTSAFGPQLEAQLDQALDQVTRSVMAAPAEVLGRASPPIEEAIDLLRNIEEPDVDAAGQMTSTLTDFLESSVADTSATLDQAGEAGAQRFQQMLGGAQQAMRAQKGRCDKLWQGMQEGLSTTLARAVEGADGGFGASIAILTGTLGETEQSIRDQLAPAVSGLEGSFRECLRDAESQIDQRVNDGLSKNTEALDGLPAKMQEAADDAAWEWDHPVLSALEFIAGILVGIIEVLALVLVLLAVTLVLAEVLGVSALVAGLVLVAGMAAFSIGYGFGARLAAGQGVGEAFTGAVVDFGRAVPGMLYDMTGIPKLRRAFSDERMTPYQRGKLIGEGGTELVLAVFMVRGAAKGIAGRFRALPRIKPPSIAPVETPRVPSLPAEAPRLPAAVEPPTRVPVSAEPPRVVETPRVPEVPRAPTEPAAPSIREPTAPTAQPGGRASLRVIEGGGEPSTAPRPRPDLRVIEGGRGRAPVSEPSSEPLPSEAQPQRARVAAGAEGYEPPFGETPQPPRRFAVIEGGAERPGGRSPIEVRASAESGGGRGPRPARPSPPSAEPSASRPATPRGAAPQRPMAPKPAAQRPVAEPTAVREGTPRVGASEEGVPRTEEPGASRGQGEPAREPRPRRPGREARAAERRAARQQAEAEEAKSRAGEPEGRGQRRTGHEEAQEAQTRRGESRRIRERAQQQVEEDLERARRGEFTHLSEERKAALLRRFERRLNQAFSDRATVERNRLKGEFDEAMRTTREARTGGRVQQQYVRGNEAMPDMDPRIRGSAIPDEVVPRVRNGRVEFEYRNLKSDNIHVMDEATARARARTYLDQAIRNDRALPQRNSIVIRFAQRPNPAARQGLLDVLFSPNSPVRAVHFGTEVVPNPNLP
jgi:hypothetical protein